MFERAILQDLDWPDRRNELNGNACKDVLVKLDKLAEVVPDQHQDIVEALRAFNAVRKSCLGQVALDSYEQDIANFKAAYLKLKIPITTKAHIVFEHIAEFFKRQNNGRGLGYYSEQARYIIKLL